MKGATMKKPRKKAIWLYAIIFFLLVFIISPNGIDKWMGIAALSCYIACLIITFIGSTAEKALKTKKHKDSKFIGYAWTISMALNYLILKAFWILAILFLAGNLGHFLGGTIKAIVDANK